MTTATTSPAKNIKPAEQIEAMSEEERVAFAATRKKRRDNDSFLFDEVVGLDDWCSVCWVRRGIFSRMFIDDGYPEAEMECAKCHHSYTFNVCDL